MPTTQPLESGGDDEGQLKAIAAFAQAQASPAPAAAPKNTAAPAAQPHAPATHNAPAPAAYSAPAPAAPVASAPQPYRAASGPRISMPSGKFRTSLHIPSLSINPSGTSGNAPGQSNSGSQHSRRQTAFTDSALQQAWKNFIDTHPSEHVLINTMRVSPPVPDAGQEQTPGTSPQTADDNTQYSARNYTVTVESQLQVDVLNKHLDQIIGHIADILANDNISFSIRANDGPASPSTWNERQVLESMTANHPDFAPFVEALQLTRL